MASKKVKSTPTEQDKYEIFNVKEQHKTAKKGKKKELQEPKKLFADEEAVEVETTTIGEESDAETEILKQDIPCFSQPEKKRKLLEVLESDDEDGFPEIKLSRVFLARRHKAAIERLENYLGPISTWPQRLVDILFDWKSVNDYSLWVLACFTKACQVPVKHVTDFLKINNKFKKRGDFGYMSDEQGILAFQHHIDAIENDEIVKGSGTGQRISETEYYVWDPLYKRLVFVHNREPVAHKYPEATTWSKFSYGKFVRKPSEKTSDKMY